MLKTKQVGRFTCSQMGPLESARMRLFQRQIAEIKTDDEAMLGMLDEWAFVASCTTPFISRDEYMQTPITELKDLLDTVAELNDDIASAGVKQSKKKKTSSQTKSISD